jgi:hypothetical protein
MIGLTHPKNNRKPKNNQCYPNGIPGQIIGNGLLYLMYTSAFEVDKI